jgi:3-isopropylmalate/(R)-2-methylmalate dehydratase large subunit
MAPVASRLAAAGAVRLSGRILFLTEDPALLRRQLDGEDLAWSPALRLRCDISTDEILPVYRMYQFDARLGEYPYERLRAGDEFPVSPGAVRNGGFAVSVSASRRGKGSSREHAPLAEWYAGIRLVIAESFERTYRDNCHDLGILTSTDFSLIDRIRRGEEIALAELVQGLDPISASVVEHGGLLAFAAARMRSGRTIPLPAAPRPQTLGEKILARHFVVDATTDRVGVPAVKPGDSGFVRADLRVSHDYITGMAAEILKAYLGGDVRVSDPTSIVLFRDHLTFLDEAITPARKATGMLEAARALALAQQRFAREQGLRLHGEQTDRKGSEGINHNMVLESYANPGDVVVSADSHAPHAGAIGCIAVGVGSTAMATSWITRDVRVVVPESVRVRLTGRVAPNVSAKDIVLFLLRHPVVKAGGLAGRIIEYDGEAVEDFGIDERATLTNMAAELGAFTGLVAPDRVTIEYLQSARALTRHRAEALCEGLRPDREATYSESLSIDVGAIRPMVALPGDPANGVFVDELTDDVRIDIAFGGSCTGSKAADMDMYVRVFEAALAEGKRLDPRVQCFIQAGSVAVRRYCEARGYLDVLRAVGVRFLEPGCGACCNAGPGVSSAPEQITLSTINRNFPGRSGPGKVYLASPYTLAASALAGRIVAYDPDPSGLK